MKEYIVDVLTLSHEDHQVIASYRKAIDHLVIINDPEKILAFSDNFTKKAEAQFKRINILQLKPETATAEVLLKEKIELTKLYAAIHYLSKRVMETQE